MSVDTVGNTVAGDPAGTRPRMPAGLVVASVAYFVAGVLLLGGKVMAFMTPDPYSGARLVPDNQGYPVWLSWLIPFVLMGFAFMIRGGGHGVRVTLTVLSVLLGLAAVGQVMDRRPGEDGSGAVAAILLLALFAFAVVLHHLPGANAYIRAVRRHR